jgi:hypothetical protein
LDPERKYFKPHRITWRKGSQFIKELDKINFETEEKNFSKSRDGIIVLDDNFHFWKDSRMEY